MEENNNIQVIDDSNNKKERNSNKGMFVGLSLSVVVLITLVSVFVVSMLNRNTSSDMNNGVSIVTDDNTELSSGTVTTTIDGRTVTYKAAYVVDGISATISSGTYESTTDDEAVFLVINGGKLSLGEDVVINKSGSEEFGGRGDNYSFYGINSAVVVVGEGSEVGITGTTINTTVNGANAVVATNGGNVVFGDVKITTTGDNSRGLHATYGGKIVGNNGTISTKGGSCAALATDRGSGMVKASGMTLSTEGAGSPLIYSTGEIEVSSSSGTATGAQIAVVEGKNSIVLNDCDFSANGIGNRKSVDNAGVMIYQSMSGDADEGTGSFTANNCTLTVLETSSVYDSVPFFFVTNTNATIDLKDSTISFSATEKFISALGTNEWGKSGSNGGKVTITTSDLETTNKDVEADSISSVSGL